MDIKLNIWASDIRNMLSDENAHIIAKDILSDGVVTLEDAIDCYTRKDIEDWLERWAEDYGYVKNED